MYQKMRIVLKKLLLNRPIQKGVGNVFNAHQDNKIITTYTVEVYHH